MKSVPMLHAMAMLFSVSIGSAYAGDGDGQSIPPPLTSTQSQLSSIPVGDSLTSPLFTIAGIEVRMWAPVAPPYNSEANGDLATRDIWSAG
jgi:hypothetical protein